MVMLVVMVVIPEELMTVVEVAAAAHPQHVLLFNPLMPVQVVQDNLMFMPMVLPLLKFMVVVAVAVQMLLAAHLMVVMEDLNPVVLAVKDIIGQVVIMILPWDILVWRVEVVVVEDHQIRKQDRVVVDLVPWL
tara:strand:+ start:120 stop:518 length:399 start_codon:yes stop_codon:yes gene_type:complete